MVKCRNFRNRVSDYLSQYFAFWHWKYVLHFLKDIIVPLCFQVLFLFLLKNIFYPNILFNFFDCYSFFRVFFNHRSQQQIYIRWDTFNILKLWGFDQFVKFWCTFMLERKFSHQHCIQCDSHCPDVNFSTVILLSNHHLWSCIAWRSARCFHRRFCLCPLCT